MRSRPLTVQLTMLFAASAGLVLVALGLAVGVLVHRHFEEQDFAELDGKLEQLERLVASTDVAADPAGLVRGLGEIVVGHPGLAVAVARAGGADLHVPPGARFPPGLWAGVAPPDGGSLRIDWREGSRSLRGTARAVAADAAGRGPLRVAAAIDLGRHAAFESAFRRTLWGSVVLAIAASVALGWIAARVGIAPLREITRTAERVSASRLAERIPEDRVPVELAALAASFNGMLGRLEDSFRRLSDFSSDLAHEMRTPITNLTTQTQVALTQPRGADEYREVLYSNLEELERLARLVEEMLFLAKSDHGLVPPAVAEVDLAAEVDRLLEFFEALASEAGVGLGRAGAAHGQADRDMLRRALGNLLSNAIRHTARGGTVTVALEERPSGGARIAVRNPGPDIAPRHLARIFDRFYRVDPVRGGTGGGAGLGLAIARAIALAHGGGLAVRSEGGLTTFTLELPRRMTPM